MAAAQQRHQQQINRGGFAHDHARDIFAYLRGEALDIFDGSRHAHITSLLYAHDLWHDKYCYRTSYAQVISTYCATSAILPKFSDRVSRWRHYMCLFAA